MTQSMPAFPPKSLPPASYNRFRPSSLRTSSRSSENSHRSWMNQSGPVPLTDHMKNRATPGTPSSAPVLAAPVLAATAVLK